MKKIALVLALALVVASALLAGNLLEVGKVNAAQLDDTKTVNTVVVEGQASIVVQPDIAKINLSVVTKSADSKTAQNDNKTIMNNVLTALQKAGVAKDDITTSHYNIYQTYDDDMMYSNDQKVQQRIYQVSNGITIKTKKIDEVGKLIDVATAAGANDIDGIFFETSLADQYYQEALQKAMLSAKQKATAITATFGKTVDLPLRVSEVDYGGDYGRNFYGEVKMMDAVSNTPIQAGGLRINATLTVEYAY